MYFESKIRRSGNIELSLRDSCLFTHGQCMQPHNFLDHFIHSMTSDGAILYPYLSTHPVPQVLWKELFGKEEANSSFNRLEWVGG